MDSECLGGIRKERIEGFGYDVYSDLISVCTSKQIIVEYIIIFLPPMTFFLHYKQTKDSP